MTGTSKTEFKLNADLSEHEKQIFSQRMVQSLNNGPTLVVGRQKDSCVDNNPIMSASTGGAENKSMAKELSAARMVQTLSNGPSLVVGRQKDSCVDNNPIMPASVGRAENKSMAKELSAGHVNDVKTKTLKRKASPEPSENNAGLSSLGNAVNEKDARCGVERKSIEPNFKVVSTLADRFYNIEEASFCKVRRSDPVFAAYYEQLANDVAMSAAKSGTKRVRFTLDNDPMSSANVSQRRLASDTSLPTRILTNHLISGLSKQPCPPISQNCRFNRLNRRNRGKIDSTFKIYEDAPGSNPSVAPPVYGAVDAQAHAQQQIFFDDFPKENLTEVAGEDAITYANLITGSSNGRSNAE